MYPRHAIQDTPDLAPPRGQEVPHAAPLTNTVSACHPSASHLRIVRLRRCGRLLLGQRLELPGRHLLLLHGPLHHRGGRQAAPERRTPGADAAVRVLPLPIPGAGGGGHVLQSSARGTHRKVQADSQQHGTAASLRFVCDCFFSRFLFIFGNE